MKLYEKALGVGALVIALAGCGGHTQEKTAQNYKSETAVEISVVPKGVAARDYGTGMSALSLVGQKDKEFIVAYNNINSCKCSQIEALIESEMNDGDNEEIILKGSYIKDNLGQSMFNFNYIKVNGYKFDVP